MQLLAPIAVMMAIVAQWSAHRYHQLDATERAGVDLLPVWNVFYKTQVTKCFRLPKDVQILAAREYYPRDLNYQRVVKFKLPHAVDFESAFLSIAKSSRFHEENRRGRYLYQEHVPDKYSRSLTFEPANQVYEVRWWEWSDTPLPALSDTSRG